MSRKINGTQQFACCNAGWTEPLSTFFSLLIFRILSYQTTYFQIPAHDSKQPRWTKFANGTDPTAHGQNSLIFFFIFGNNANAILHS
jgi:hypothetical protein